MSSPAMPEQMTIDDFEKAQATPEPPKLDQIKLDGDGVPDDLKGKSVAEIVQMTKALAESLKLSERSRTQAEQMAAMATRSAPAPVAAPAAPAEPELTDEQLAELHSTDPLRAIRYMQQQAINAASKNLEARIGNLFTSSAAVAETTAREKFKAEFEVLGPEISAMAKQIPNAEQVLTTPEAWERLISLVRGTPGNFEKVQQYYVSKATGRTLESARQQQQEDAGVSMVSSVRAPGPSIGVELDPIQKEIAGKLGLSEADYIKWSKV